VEQTTEHANAELDLKPVRNPIDVISRQCIGLHRSLFLLIIVYLNLDSYELCCHAIPFGGGGEEEAEEKRMSRTENRRKCKHYLSIKS
jgi:hypothetical protein